MSASSDRPVLIVGGAGFIGCNLAAQLARSGKRVRIYDDLSRPGVERNLAWLCSEYSDVLEVRIADLRERDQLRAAVQDARAVFHLAAQVAVTASLVDPRHDFDVNLGGTFELLEALRALPRPPPLVFTSTNKVYGGLPEVALRVHGTRWTPVDPELIARGIDERRPLELVTPFACSKGSADQYVLDYARSYGLPATVFRVSCVYGPHQLGTEDQGWIAHFLRCALERAPITIYGDGCQVRDVLFVEDLVDGLLRAWTQIDAVRGHAFNIGGGPRNTLSLLELIDMIGQLRGRRPDVTFEAPRAGDQRYYVSDTSAFTAATAWRPRIGPRAGVESLHGWLVADRNAAVSAAPGVIHA